jgi:hypothetical protein
MRGFQGRRGVVVLGFTLFSIRGFLDHKIEVFF